MPQSLSAWLSRLESLHPVAIDMGLDRVRVVGERLGVLRPGVPVVTVGGTNGKGSVTALLDALLRAHGKRTALYTSPHILRFNERIRIDGSEATDADIVRALEQVEAARGDVSLTYFEFTTLAAFVLFAQARPDVWVLEIGLGGRLDAVNLIDADVAVLTSIALDHMEYLGPTREDIGREKAGILRAGRPLVLGETDVPQSVEAAIRELAVPAWRAAADFRAQAGDDAAFSWQGRAGNGHALTLSALPRPALALPNVAVALQALHLLPFAVDAQAVAAALRAVKLPGRNQLLRTGNRALVIDVGHNPPALRFLAGELPRHRLGARFHVVLAMLADKDMAGAVAELEAVACSWHIAPLPGPRGGGIDALRQALQGSRWPVTVHAAVAAALRDALTTADGLPVLAVGSFHTVAEVLAALPSADPDTV